MYKIGEFSKIVSVTVKALHYYDEIGLLSPSYINKENGYRYYNEASYYQIMRIKMLKKYGFTIKEIQDVMPNIKSSQDMIDYLLEKQDHFQEQILSIKKIQQQISKEVQTLKEVKLVNNNTKAEIVEIPEIRVASIRYKGKYEEIGKYLGKLFKAVAMKRISQPFSMYYDESYTEENADIEVCIEVKDNIDKGGIITKVLPKIKCASITHVGSYESLSVSYKALADFIVEKGLESYTPSREIYIKGPGMLFKGDPDKYETKILFPVK